MTEFISYQKTVMCMLDSVSVGDSHLAVPNIGTWLSQLVETLNLLGYLPAPARFSMPLN